MIAEVRDKQQKIAALCERFAVIRLGVFGSATRGDFDPSKSDLDFLVLFDRRDDADYLDRFFGLLWALEALFDRPVDLVTELSLRKPRLRAAIEQDLESLYVRPGVVSAA
jgi:predicted nucleotidyltransferase